MASPAAAGTALLVRQYFMDTNTRFWTKVCRSIYKSCKAFEPSGVMTKAILLHSTSPMSLYHGGGSKDQTLGPPPDFVQGFGRITLKNVLPLANAAGHDLFVDDLATIGENSQISYAVRLGATDPVLPIK